MKFDFIIGNPPYQEEAENSGDRANPLYDKFMDKAFEIADIVLLIHPARFLFNAGQTQKRWNQKMLNDEHLKVLMYEPNATSIFQNTEIKGGIAITIRNANESFGAIGTFTRYEEISSVIERIKIAENNEQKLDSIISSQGVYRFTDKFFREHPEANSFIGKGTGNKIVSSAVEKLENVFLTEKSNIHKPIRLLARVGNQRIWKWVSREYVEPNEYLTSYNLLIPEANNSGHYGEVLTEPSYARPGEGASDTFLSAGTFKTLQEAKNLALYMKTKFFRALLGVKKVTQHCPPAVWKLIPLQDFTPNSDIDWSKSISEIDQQLYKKYKLNKSEIDFIESHVKEMK